MGRIKEFVTGVLNMNDLVENISKYLETRVALFKLSLKEDISKFFSGILFYFILAHIVLSFLFFVSFGLVYWINHFFYDEYLGYWIIASAYVILFFIIFLSRKRILKKTEKCLKSDFMRG